MGKTAGACGHQPDFRRLHTMLNDVRDQAPLPRLSASEASADGLFPLRFTPFEYYLWLDDRPDYPAVFFIRLECRGKLDREAFEKAFYWAHERHPLLSARIEQERNGWPSWHSDRPARIEWCDTASDSGETPMAAAPAARVRLRTRVSRSGDRTVLSFAFDHVAADGMGGFQFVTDLMLAYAHACSGNGGPPAIRPLETGLLRDRGGARPFNRTTRLGDLVRVARIGLSLLFSRAALVSDHGTPPRLVDEEQADSDFIAHTLTRHETAVLSRVARKLSVRLHDLLLRDYFLMLADWNCDTCEARRPIRVLVPTNLRRKQDYRMPAANVFGYAFLARWASACESRAQLLASVRDEMATIKRTRSGAYYQATLRLIALWPALLRKSLQRESPFATAVFTNLNAGFDHVALPWRDGRRVAGNLTVENGFGAGPIRPGTRISMATHNYAGQMSVAVVCDRRSFDPGQQRALLEAYLDKLRLTIASES